MLKKDLQALCAHQEQCGSQSFQKVAKDLGLQNSSAQRTAKLPPAQLLTSLLCSACRNITEMMTTVSLQIVGIIEPIIQHADWFFPGGMCQHPHLGDRRAEVGTGSTL